MTENSTPDPKIDFKNVWAKILSNGEKVEYEFSLSNTYRYIGLIFGIIVGLLLLYWNQSYGVTAIIFFIFYFGFYLKAANAYAFTDKRILIHRGWLSTKLTSVDYKKITDVKAQEPFFTKLFYKAGHLVINTAGSSDSEIILKNIPTPYKLIQKLDELRKDK